jgi:hypothetical protein
MATMPAPVLAPADQAVFDAVLVTLRPRQARFVREYYAAGKVAEVAAARAGYHSGGDPRGSAWAGSAAIRRSRPIRAAVEAIDRLIARRLVPGLDAAMPDDLDAIDAALTTVRKRQALFICHLFACNGNGSEAARRAGYSDKNGHARCSANQIMQKPAVSRKGRRPRYSHP